MPISPISKSYGTSDAKIAKLTADPAGGSPTYGSLVDVPGIKSVTISGSVNRTELRGDHQLLDAESVLTDITVTFEHGKFSLDVLEVFFDTTVVDAGTTPNMTATWALEGADKPNYFGFAAKVAAADTVGGDAHLTLFKCKLDGFPDIGTAEEDYKTFSVSGVVVPRLADNKWLRVALNETASALS